LIVITRRPAPSQDGADLLPSYHHPQQRHRCSQSEQRFRIWSLAAKKIDCKESDKSLAGESTIVADGRNYTFTLKADADGIQHFLIREAPPARSRSVRHWTSTFAESLNTLRADFQKALRFVSRRT
jgi:hypothetical protein